MTSKASIKRLSGIIKENMEVKNKDSIISCFRPGMTRWRNGSASDSRSEGCVFKSRPGHLPFFFVNLTLSSFQESIKETFLEIEQFSVPPGYEGHPGLNKDKEPYQFYYDVMKAIASEVEEDKSIYQPLVQRYSLYNLNIAIIL